jgi:4'-phosphopantetheinyl transferase EntD
LAVVASSSDCAGIGVDVETLGRISPRTWRGFLQETEQVWIDTQPEEKKALWASRFFAVKEAFYKLQYPQTGVWLGCLGATLILKDEAGGVSVFRLEITDDRHPWFKNIPKKVQLTAMEADGVVVALAI